MLAHRGNSYSVKHAKSQQHSRDSSYMRSRVGQADQLFCSPCILPQHSGRRRLIIMVQDVENIQPDKLLTDRSSYISYLESQLERLTNACLTVQSFDERIQANAAAARALEEKVDCTV